MRYEILRWVPVAVVLLFLAGVYLWFWLVEKRFATQVDRRFAPYKTEPKDREISEREWRDMSMPTEERFWELEQRVTALEEQQEVFLLHIPNLWKEVVALKRFAGLAATPSPPTAPDLTPGPTANVTMPTSLKGVKVHMEKTEAPTTLTP